MSGARFVLPDPSAPGSRPRVTAVINVTPDSFSDGGRFASLDEVVAFGRACAEQGVALLDVGGESTRPGAVAVSAAEEIARVVPAIRALCSEVGLPVSVDTTKAAVARAALGAGASVVNDVSGGLFDPSILSVVADAGAVYICGHVRGRTLAEVHAASEPTWDDVAAELAERVRALPPALAGQVIVDPGIGFAKGLELNLELLRRCRELAERLSCQVMVGPSRKRFLGTLTGQAAGARDAATVGACLAAAGAGAHHLRVHDPAPLMDALLVYSEVMKRGAGQGRNL